MGAARDRTLVSPMVLAVGEAVNRCTTKERACKYMQLFERRPKTEMWQEGWGLRNKDESIQRRV